MKIVKFLEESGLLVKGVTETIKNEPKAIEPMLKNKVFPLFAVSVIRSSQKKIKQAFLTDIY